MKQHFTSLLLCAAAISAVAQDRVVTLDVSFDRTESEELMGLFAMDASGAVDTPYYGLSEIDGGHVFNFTLPDGTYDFFVGVALGNLEGYAMLTIDGVEVTADQTLTLSTSSATNRTDINHIGPDGTPLRLKGSYPDGNATRAGYVQVLTYGDTRLMTTSSLSESETYTYVLSNNPSTAFKLTRLDAILSQQGALSMVIPIDLTKESVGTDAANWQCVTERFASTPANDTYLAFKNQQEPDYFYTCAPTIVTCNGEYYTSIGLGTFDPTCPANTVGIWLPENYDGSFNMLAMPLGSAIKGWDSSISGLPLQRSADGLRQVGINVLPDRAIYLSYGQRAIGPENEAFSGEIADVELGNCTPMLIIIPEEEFFEFSFTGRHGEAISHTAAYYTIPSIEYWEDIFSGPLCDLKFFCNDELVSDCRYDFPYDVDWSEGNYRLEVTNSNVLIDGETEGYNHIVHTFDSSTSDMPVPPTLTSLRILDATGAINDRLNSVDGAKVAFTGGHFVFVYDPDIRVEYAEFDPVSCVAVEYSPRGADEFEPLTFREVGEPILPGYGNDFEADLSGVNRESADGWFDLRITIEDGNGATQTQTLSPAFKFTPSHSGLTSVFESSTDAPVEYFNLQGVRISEPQSGQVVIRRSGNKVAKIRVE